MPYRTILPITLIALAALLTGCGAAPAAPEPTTTVAAILLTTPTTAATAHTAASLDTATADASPEADTAASTAAPVARDPNTTFLVRGATLQSMLFTVIDDTLRQEWPAPQTLVQITRWEAPDRALEAVDGRGAVRVDQAGQLAYTWGATGPSIDISGKTDPFLFRPDGAEIVYERDGDIYSKAAKPDSPEVRWTSGQSFSAVTGWVDADTVTAQYPDRLGSNGFIVRRDGQVIDIGDFLLRPYRPNRQQAPSGLMVDPRGLVRFVARGDGSFYTVGAGGLTQVGDATAGSNAVATGLTYLTWTGDAQALIFINEDGTAPPQLLALSNDGLRPVAAELQLPRGGPQAWTAVPGSNQIAMVAQGPAGEGIYLIDVDRETVKLIGRLAAARLIGINARWLAAVIDDGSTSGSYALRLDGGEPRLLTDAPIEGAFGGPDGQLWLIGAQKLWRFDPTGNGQATVISGGEQLAAYAGAELLWSPIRVEPLPQALVGQEIAPTSTPAPLTAVDTPNEQLFVTAPGTSGSVVVWAEPSTRSRETLRLPAGIEVLCAGFVEGEAVDGSTRWASCPDMGGYIIAAQLTPSDSEIMDSPNNYPALVTTLRSWQFNGGLEGAIRDFCIRGGNVALVRIAPTVDSTATLVILELNGGLWEVAHSGPYQGGNTRWDAARTACRWR